MRRPAILRRDAGNGDGALNRSAPNGKKGVVRRGLTLFAYLLVSLLAMLAAYLLAAVLLGLLPVNRDYRPAREGVDVYLSGNGVHTDIIVPIQALDVDWRGRLPVAALWPIAGLTDELAFGWGDRNFYIATPTWADARLSSALIALVGLDRTVLHVEAVGVPRPGADTRHLRLSAPQYRRLVAFIEASFARNSAGAAIAVPGAHYGPHDAFFEAKGHYSLFLTCNEWTRKGLETAGVRAPYWAPFDKALFYQLPPDGGP